LSCQWVKPADPKFQKKPLANESYSGFISRDFFQLVVEVPIKLDPIPLKKLREDCKQRSVPIRNRMTIPILIQEVKDSENDRLRGINRIRYSYPRQGSASDPASQGGIDPSGSSTPIATPLFPTPLVRRPSPERSSPPNLGTGESQFENPETEEGREFSYGNLLFDRNLSYLQGEFAWFLDSYRLYKEDYSQPGKCVFIYRVAGKGLYDRVEETNLSIPWKDYE